jgi:hypothetical protein
MAQRSASQGNSIYILHKTRSRARGTFKFSNLLDFLAAHGPKDALLSSYTPPMHTQYCVCSMTLYERQG